MVATHAIAVVDVTPIEFLAIEQRYAEIALCVIGHAVKDGNAEIVGQGVGLRCVEPL